jgi:hypothetical protein
VLLKYQQPHHVQQEHIALKEFLRQFPAQQATGALIKQQPLFHVLLVLYVLKGHLFHKHVQLAQYVGLWQDQLLLA